MDAQKNKEIVRRYIDELNKRNIGILEELVSDSFREIVREGYKRNITAFPDYSVQVHNIICEREEVVVEWAHTGTHLGVYNGVPPTGKTITGNAISIYRIENGRIVDARGIWDRGEVWQQLDLIPDTNTILSKSRKQDEGGS